MKTVLSLLLTCCIFFSFCSAASAAGENYDTLADWNVRIAVPEGATAVLEGSEYYLYAQTAGSIPYVMLRTYRAEDAEAFLEAFTAFMQEQYADLTVTADAHEITLGGRVFHETDYSYKVSGYDVVDRRIVLVADGTAYLFTSKEVPELGMTVGSMLEDVAANCEFVSDGGADQDLGLSDGYLYCDENGIPRYWLDFTRTAEDNLVLHCWFRSGGPAFSESCYVLDLSSAEITEDGLKIRQVRGLQDDSPADRIGNLTLLFYLDAAVMTAEQNGETPAETSEDRMMPGSYIMIPTGAAADPGRKESHPCPAEEGPYPPEELEKWARIYSFRNTGIFLPEAEVTAQPDGTYTIRLAGTADSGGDGQPAEARYTVDAYGEGKDDLTGEPVSLTR